ncbi:MAG: hypothetical protein RLZZ301_1176 [Bacteroidota bacterium]|jgi:hypothetical protein
MNLSEAQLAHLVLAYHEDQLSTNERHLLDDYLKAHPELQEELTSFIYLDHSDAQYKGSSLIKENLENVTCYAEEQGHPYEKLAIAAQEGELSAVEKKLLIALETDPAYQFIAQQISQTVLIPDYNMQFPNLQRLEKQQPVVRFVPYLTYAAVAVAALFIGVLLVIWPSSPTRHFAQQGKKDKNPPSKLAQAPEAPVVSSVNSTHPMQSTSHLRFDSVSDTSVRIISVIPDQQGHSALQNNSTDGLNTLSRQAVATTTQPVLLHDTDQYSMVSEKAAAGPLKPSSESITMKAFLVQKGNERLFGTAKPSEQQRIETITNYAQQTIGIPLNYSHLNEASRERTVWQIGPIRIEKSSAKK